MIADAFRQQGKRLAALARREPFLAVVTLLALLYVAAALSPSSYAVVLRSFEVADDGLIFGWPQWIRGDEYAVWTPTVQAVVASGFGPVNVTSLYGERFRSLSSLPLADWGLLFKPQFWAFFVISPARAYSAYHAFHGWAFLVGWIVFFRRLGVGRAEAALATVLLLASAWAQTWWTSLAPVLVYAPFFVLPLLLPMRASWRALAAFYVTAAWLLDGLFYPPLYVAAGLAASLAIFAFRPDVLRPGRLAAWAAGVGAGIALAAFYHWDALLETAASSLHGARNLAGGTVLWQDYLGTFLPSFPYHGWSAIFGSNACESSSAGSILWLLLLFFVAPASFKAWTRDREGRLRLWRSGGLVLLFALATLWMLAPVPAIWGKPLLWHLTPPTRLLLLPGLLSLFLALLLLPRLELRWSVARALLFSFLVLAAWDYTERGLAEGGPISWRSTVRLHADLLLIPLVFALPLVERVRQRFFASRETVAPKLSPASLPPSWLAPSSLSPASLLAAAAAANLLFFGLYNPIQSSRAIFAKHDSPKLRALQVMQDAHPRGWLVVGGVGYFGSVLNGLGFRSVNHALLNSEVARFARFFPNLRRENRERLFHRYLNVQVSPYAPPFYNSPLFLPNQPADNAVLLPPEPFLPKLAARLKREPPSPLPVATGATTRALTVGPKWWLLEVQGPIGGLTGAVAIEIHTDPPARRLIATWRLPPVNATERLGLDLYSRLLVELNASGEAVPEQGLGWCITLLDPVAGPRQVGPAPGHGRSTCPHQE